MKLFLNFIRCSLLLGFGLCTMNLMVGKPMMCCASPAHLLEVTMSPGFPRVGPASDPRLKPRGRIRIRSSCRLASRRLTAGVIPPDNSAPGNSTAQAATTRCKPGGVFIPQVTNGSPTTITNVVFSWLTPVSDAGVNGYSYGFDQVPGGATNTVATNVAINGVVPGTHLFAVMAQDTNGLWGPIASFTLIVISVPGAPPDLVCDKATNGLPTTISNLVFSWQPPSSSTGLGGYSYGFDQLPGNLINTMATTVALSNVTLGAHVFQVQAQDTNGMWGPPAVFRFSVWAPGTEPPDAPAVSCNLASQGIPVYATDDTAITNVIFSWTTPHSENGVAGYSYALNDTPDPVINATDTSVMFASLALGTYNFQVMAQGSNGIWGATASFTLIVGQPPTTGPLPRWSLVVLTLGFFAIGAWFIRRPGSPRLPAG
jgi:hypothetical protein